MNILFLTMSSGMENISSRGIYTDLMRKFRDEGNEVYIIFPRERKLGLPTEISVDNHVHSLGVRTLNVTKTNVIEKGIGQLLIEYQFMSAFKKYIGNVKFDLILYSTPPITFTKVIKSVKKSNPNAISYLLLKDIFPQNAVDIGMLRKTGLKGILYRRFRKTEKKLYRLSDRIGCMSEANVEYVLNHNPEIPREKVEICPNAIEVQLCAGKAGDFVMLGGSKISEIECVGEFPVKDRSGDAEKAEGEWNEATVICKGGKITVYVNGQLLNECTTNNSEGYIALQSEGGPIEFRNLWLE